MQVCEYSWRPSPPSCCFFWRECWAMFPSVITAIHNDKCSCKECTERIATSRGARCGSSSKLVAYGWPLHRSIAICYTQGNPSLSATTLLFTPNDPIVPLKWCNSARQVHGHGSPGWRHFFCFRVAKQRLRHGPRLSPPSF